jgi:hypothetical protein
MAFFIVYHTPTGKILKSGSCDTDELILQHNENNNEQTLETSMIIDDSLFYILNNQLILRPVIDFNKKTIVSDGIDMCSITLPTGTYLDFGGEIYTFNSEEIFEYTSNEDQEVQYSIILEFPYKERIKGVIKVITT